MDCTRRDLSWILPILTVATTKAQSAALPSKFYSYDELTAKSQGDGKQRPFFDGKLHTGTPISLHETELPPGGAPHGAHQHVHEEIVIIREGTLEVTISGKSRNLGPGSVAYMASNDPHGVRNAGNTTARYYILALGSD